MTIPDDLAEIQAFCDVLGLSEEPLGMYYTPKDRTEPQGVERAIKKWSVVSKASGTGLRPANYEGRAGDRPGPVN